MTPHSSIMSKCTIINKALIVFLLLYPGLSLAATSTITSGQSDTNTTYAPEIFPGENTNITAYDINYRWIYTLHTFKVCKSGTYTSDSTTTDVINATFFLNGTFTPSLTFPPSTPITNFFISSYNADYTVNFTNLNLVAGQQYSVLITYFQETPGTHPYQNTLNITGPGTVVFNGNGSCSISHIPTISEWAQVLMILSIIGIAGWSYQRIIS